MEASAREISHQYWKRAQSERKFCNDPTGAINVLIYEALSRAFRDFADQLNK